MRQLSLAEVCITRAQSLQQKLEQEIADLNDQIVLRTANGQSAAEFDKLLDESIQSIFDASRT